MKYAKEVIRYLGSSPGTWYRMIEIVNFAGAPKDMKERNRIRRGVQRVLEQLERGGVVESRMPESRGAYGEYRWKSVT